MFPRKRRSPTIKTTATKTEGENDDTSESTLSQLGDSRSSHMDAVTLVEACSSSIFFDPINGAENNATSCLIHRTQESSLRNPYSRNSNRRQKRVGWANLEIHTHGMILGDNPSVSSGIPVSIAWAAESHSSAGIDDYETLKQQQEQGVGELHRTPTRDEMRLSRLNRDDICRRAGYSRSEIKNAIDEVRAVQENRNKSAQEGQWMQRWLKVVRKNNRSSNDFSKVNAQAEPL